MKFVKFMYIINIFNIVNSLVKIIKLNNLTIIIKRYTKWVNGIKKIINKGKEYFKKADPNQQIDNNKHSQKFKS